MDNVKVVRRFIYYLLIIIFISSIYQFFFYDSIKHLHVLTGLSLMLIPSVILATIYVSNRGWTLSEKIMVFIGLLSLIYIVSGFILVSITWATGDFFSRYHFERRNAASTERMRLSFENSTITKGLLKSENGITTYTCKKCDYSISFPEEWTIQEEEGRIDLLYLLPSSYIEWKRGCIFNIANRSQQKIGDFYQSVTYNGIEFSVYRKLGESSYPITETIESSFNINRTSYSLIGNCTQSKEVDIDKQFMDLLSTIKIVTE